MFIRKAATHEVPILSRLRQSQLIDEGQAPNCNIDDEVESFLRRRIEDGSLIEWVAEDNGRIVATSAIVFYDFPPSFENPHGMRGYITNMYTAPDYRGRGLAPILLDKLVDEAKARDVHIIFLAASELGKPVYRKYGFSEAPEWMEL